MGLLTRVLFLSALSSAISSSLSSSCSRHTFSSLVNTANSCSHTNTHNNNNNNRKWALFWSLQSTQINQSVRIQCCGQPEIYLQIFQTTHTMNTYTIYMCPMCLGFRQPAHGPPTDSLTIWGITAQCTHNWNCTFSIWLADFTRCKSHSVRVGTTFVFEFTSQPL